MARAAVTAGLVVYAIDVTRQTDIALVARRQRRAVGVTPGATAAGVDLLPTMRVIRAVTACARACFFVV